MRWVDWMKDAVTLSMPRRKRMVQPELSIPFPFSGFFFCH
jgi:hypothetical protein